MFLIFRLFSGSLYYNYKGYFSIVLLGACDVNYCFTAIDIGAFGSESDGGVLARSEFGSRLINNTLDLPKDTSLPGSKYSISALLCSRCSIPVEKQHYATLC